MLSTISAWRCDIRSIGVNAIVVVSDNARDEGACHSDVYDVFHAGLSGTTAVPATATK
jgi:hypothetical protein